MRVWGRFISWGLSALLQGLEGAGGDVRGPLPIRCALGLARSSNIKSEADQVQAVQRLAGVLRDFRA